MKILDQTVILPARSEISSFYLSAPKFRNSEQQVGLINTSKLKVFQDRRNIRNYNRPSLLALATLSEDLRSRLSAIDLTKVGVYAYVPRCEVFEVFLATYKKGPLPESFKKWVSPKSALINNPNLVAANISIELGITGPSVSYGSGLTSFEFVLDQIKFDLEVQRVEYALLVGVLSLETYLVLNHFESDSKSDIIAESAVSVLFGSSGTEVLKTRQPISNEFNFGPMASLIGLLEGIENEQDSNF